MCGGGRARLRWSFLGSATCASAAPFRSRYVCRFLCALTPPRAAHSLDLPQNTASLVSAIFPNLTTMTAGCTIQARAVCARLSPAPLAQIAFLDRAQTNTALVSIKFPLLASVGSTYSVSGNAPAMTTFEMPSLKTMALTFTFSVPSPGCPAWRLCCNSCVRFAVRLRAVWLWLALTVCPGAHTRSRTTRAT